MCGIVGVAGNITQNLEKVFRDMLIMDTVRGQDSTGVIHVTGGDKVSTHKEVGGPTELWSFQNPMFNPKGIFKMVPKVVIGHNRAATVGKVTTENAHPFEFDDVVGVHNGSLTYIKDLHGGDKYEVDSQALYQTINDIGIEETWKKFHGAASLVWWDKKEKRLNFARNDQRPMCYAWTEKEDCLVFASEAWMITAACSRNRVGLKSFTSETVDTKGVKSKVTAKVFSTTVNKSYKFKVGWTKCDLESTTELKKACQNNNYKVTNLSKTNVPTSKKVEKGNEKKGKRINIGWAKNLERCDKEDKGKTFRINFAVYPGSLANCGNITSKYIGYMEDSPLQKIEIFPETIADDDEIARHVGSYGNKPLYRIKSRPRFRYVDSKSDNKILMIGSSNIVRVSSLLKDIEPEEKKEPLYPVYAGKLVTEKEWRKAVAEAGNACCWCSDPITLLDSGKMNWVMKDAFECPYCAQYAHSYVNLNN